MVSEKSLANAAGGKTARACDSCIRKRARWYCAADDAFLCQSCDASVHTANSLARRHERLRLKGTVTSHHVIPTAVTKETSNKHPEGVPYLENSLPLWRHGFARKARTPRRHGYKRAGRRQDKAGERPPSRNPIHLVPELGGDETSHEETEDQLLYRVPVFDPFAAELCNLNEPATIAGGGEEKSIEANSENEIKATPHNSRDEMNKFQGFHPSDMDLAEFAADVESLLGKALDEESFNIEGLGLLDCKERNSNGVECSFSSGKVKVEDDDEEEENMGNNHVDESEIDMAREPFELSFDYDSPEGFEEEDQKPRIYLAEGNNGKDDGESKVAEVKKMKSKKKNSNILLNLDYDGVMTAWADHKSPWTTSERPDLDPSDCWPHCMGVCERTNHNSYGDMGLMGIGHGLMGDGGRDAKVLRYREKRRTRLFSKKIRYEVRKLNAEKRPRMKGRFVKKANFGAPTFPFA